MFWFEREDRSNLKSKATEILAKAMWQLINFAFYNMWEDHHENGKLT